MRDKTPRWDNNASEVLLAIQFDASVTLTYKLAFAFQMPSNLLLSCLCQSYGADSPLWAEMTSSTTWPNRMTNWTCPNHDIFFYFCWHCSELGGSFEVNVQLSLKAASLWWSFNRPVTRIVQQMVCVFQTMFPPWLASVCCGKGIWPIFTFSVVV